MEVYFRPKCRLTFNRLHGFISHKIELFVTTGLRTQNPKYLLRFILKASYRYSSDATFLYWMHPTDTPQMQRFILNASYRYYSDATFLYWMYPTDTPQMQRFYTECILQLLLRCNVSILNASCRYSSDATFLYWMHPADTLQIQHFNTTDNYTCLEITPLQIQILEVRRTDRILNTASLILHGPDYENWQRMKC
jgi:hypothetical protein